ncbi:hypothetical protein BDU57DRAFT_259519 [Ampelomyces quisqualis]|uniref:Uncharacterized protein n=1 Tax=Ampelomyces quisqualis TaxID=50730 RepID=A0A6A5QP73_AMPQU|nr:hypothetical protein BDU57DRAFT_259519 [Ampelomyces quisqualis]
MWIHIVRCFNQILCGLSVRFTTLLVSATSYSVWQILLYLGYSVLRCRALRKLRLGSDSRSFNLWSRRTFSYSDACRLRSWHDALLPN